MDIPASRSLQKKGKTNMETLSRQNRQNADSVPNPLSSPSGSGPLERENHPQSPGQSSTGALDEASRDAETFGSTGEATPNAQGEQSMPFNNGYYQPTEGASLPTPYGQPVPEGNPLGRLTIGDSSPIFADTILSDNVRKRFLFAKNQRQRPIPAGSEESSGLGGQNRPISNVHKRGDFVNYRAGGMLQESRAHGDIHEEFGARVQDPSDGQFRNQNLSYNTPIGFANKYMAPIPGSASTISPSFAEPHRPSARGAAYNDLISSLHDRQAPRSHLSMNQNSEEGSKFVAEQLIPLHTFSPEKLVPRYQMDSSTSSPQEQLPNLKSPGPPINYTEGGFQRGLPGTNQDLHPVERAGEKTRPYPSNLGGEEFIASQRAKARSRPLYWQIQCPQTMNPAGSCHYGASCRYGHNGDVYEDNLSVHYTFENGRSCPNFVSPATPGPPRGTLGLSPPAWAIPDARSQAQALHAGQSNQAFGGPGASHSHHAPSQPTASSSSHQNQTPFVVDEALFRREPLIRAQDYYHYCRDNGIQPQRLSDLAADMQATYMMEGGGVSDNVQQD